MFPLKSPFDIEDVFIEGIYLLFALFSLYMIYRLGSFSLLLGWFIFIYGLTFDFLDEFTKEPDLFSVHLEGFLTAAGLLIIAVGFYREYDSLQSLKSSLQRSNHRLELAHELSHQGVWEYDPDTKDSYFSQRCLEIAGYDSGRPFNYSTWMDLIHEDDRGLMSSTIDNLNESGNPAEINLRIIDLSGNLKWIRMRLGLDSTDSSNYSHKIVGICLDITSQKHAEDDLTRSKELREMFVDILRHDLLNPIGVIQGYAGLLSKGDHDEATKKYLQRIIQSTKKLVEMVTDASSFAKVESQKDVEFTRIDLRRVVVTTIDEMRPAWNEKGIHINFFGEHEVLVKSSKFIKNAFENLLSNAIKYSPDGSTVRVSIEDMDTYWKINVLDNGPGVLDEDKGEIFERFSRAHKGAIKGTGLGLAIVKRVMELSNGEAGVSDNPEGGSIFWISGPKF
ncbi:PAS domain S-box-containing protein [Methanohalophilus levihalophilus]|uniref:PAS domain-containing sensor histidine kinase n=1 Tax=Methanohalophilus levihalophilus TaxID=1431282 RepID=UPI001AE68645|nr:HAMP domain-containing sensor histidine kinase [Methanohalophilus levihalophilus]MBP2030700.1 PAS domain S-box-containing protein [Methanohalophilus levihalophilus]